MKVLVTGTDGYIGSLLGPTLMERGHEVVGLDVGFYKDGWLYDGVKKVPETICKDIRTVTEHDLVGFDAVIHLAELSNDPLGQLNPSITFQINHLGSVNLAKHCKRAGVPRFIYSSSCSVYGLGEDGLRTEESSVDPQTAYAKCKILVEQDVSQLADEDFSPTFLRNATAFGPSPRMRFDLVLNNLAGLAWTTRCIRMTSDGTPWRPLVHVKDICEAMACVMEAPRSTVHNQVFNVGSTQANYQVRDIARIVAEVCPGCELIFGNSDGDNRSYRVSFEKIRAMLPEFSCNRDARIGAEELVEVFQRIGMSEDIFRFRPYTRLKQLEYAIGVGLIDDGFFWKVSHAV